MILQGRRREKRKASHTPARTRRATVTPAEARIEAERRVCMASFARFCQEAWHVVEPGKVYQHNWHIDVICEHLEALFFRRPAVTGPLAGQPIRDLVINIPPRHMKSLTCSVMFPAWCWTHDPGRQFFYSSYAQHLSDDHAALTMQLVRSEWYQLRFGPTGNQALDAPGFVELRGKKRTRHFETSKGGARQSSSVMGKTTGAGGDILVADDPHNVLERESDRKMARVITWWSRAMASRGNDPRTFGRLVIMQRIAEGDLADWCIRQGYALLKLPARFEGESEIGVLGHVDPREEEGEPLWAGRFGDLELTKLETSLQEDAAGQLQQRPAPVGGRTFRVGSVRRMSQRVYSTLLAPGRLDELIMVWDLASKGRAQRKKAKRSYTVGAVWGRRGPHVFLFDVWRDQVRFAEQLEGIEEMAHRWPQARPLYIENKANGIPGGDLLTNRIPGILLVEPRGDKDLRANAVSPFFKAGNVWVPEDEMFDWVRPWLREHEYFPDAANDDQVDTTSMALDLLLVQGWAEPMAPEGSAMTFDDSDPTLAAARERQRARLRAHFREGGAPDGVRTFTGAGYQVDE